MTKRQERILKAVLKCEGICYKHNYRCMACPLDVRCTALKLETTLILRNARLELAEEALAGLELEKILKGSI